MDTKKHPIVTRPWKKPARGTASSPTRTHAVKRFVVPGRKRG